MGQHHRFPNSSVKAGDPQIPESPLPASRRVWGPEIDAQGRRQLLHDTFREMRDLLESYSPTWYSEDLRDKVEFVAKGLASSELNPEGNNKPQSLEPQSDKPESILRKSIND